MAALDVVCGNEALRGALGAALRSGRLAQSILLLGEPGLGVNFTARCLAADYLYPDGGAPARAVLRGESPECLTLCGEGASGDIRIERVRAVRAEIANTPLLAQGRVVLIHGADHLNTASANALLKTLEEPPENVLFVLTAPDAACVLPTVRSRCCAYSLAPVGEEACAAYLKRCFPAIRGAGRYAALFGGRIGSAKKTLASAEGRALLADALALCAACEARDTYAALVIFARHESGRAGACALLALLRTACGAALRGAQEALVPVSAQRAAVCAEAATRSTRLLQGNVNTKLVLTACAARITA